MITFLVLLFIFATLITAADRGDIVSGLLFGTFMSFVLTFFISLIALVISKGSLIDSYETDSVTQIGDNYLVKAAGRDNLVLDGGDCFEVVISDENKVFVYENESIWPVFFDLGCDKGYQVFVDAK